MSAGVSSFEHSESQRTEPIRADRLPIVGATAGDHAAIRFFLESVGLAPSRAEFRASLDEPFYHPRDRLLVRDAGRIVAHVHLRHRTVEFGRTRLAAACIERLAVAPEYRGLGIGQRLLATAERRARRDGALLVVARAPIPGFFQRSGWAPYGRNLCSLANVRALRARLRDDGWCGRRRRAMLIRPLRRWEVPGLVRVYADNLPGLDGAAERTDAYWRWLVDRRAYDEIYVALRGRDQDELIDPRDSIAGYAVLRGERIVELLTAPPRRRVAAELLDRACGEAIENDRHHLLLSAPARSPLHDLLLRAGGLYLPDESDGAGVPMVKVVDPTAALRRLARTLRRRARRANLPEQFEIGLAVDRRRYSLRIGPRGVRVAARRSGRTRLRLRTADFTRMVLGQLDWAAALGEARVAASSQAVVALAGALFPPMPLWRPPLDDLEAG